jgi:MFS family permease
MKLLPPVLLRGSSRATETVQTDAPRAPHPDPMPRWGRAFSTFAVLSNLDTDNAIWLIYLAMRGYSPFAIGLFEMLFHVAKFLAEMPTGIFADLVGRRASLVGACVCGAVSAALLLDPTPQMVALSFVCSGISWAFKGGAQEAVVCTLGIYAGQMTLQRWPRRKSLWLCTHGNDPS